jgi:hypothetical protein
MEETTHSQELGIDRRIILEWLFGKWVGGCGLDASGRVQWQALVNMIMNLWVSYKTLSFLRRTVLQGVS